MVKKINFFIDKNGEVSLDVEGTTGSDCKDFTKAFEQIIGTVESRDLKDSYYQQEQESDYVQTDSQSD